MSYEQYSKATKETAENLRIIDDACILQNMMHCIMGR